MLLSGYYLTFHQHLSFTPPAHFSSRIQVPYPPCLYFRDKPPLLPILGEIQEERQGLLEYNLDYC